MCSKIRNMEEISMRKNIAERKASAEENFTESVIE